MDAVSTLKPFFLSKEFVWDYKPAVLLGTTNFLLEAFDQQSK